MSITDDAGKALQRVTPAMRIVCSVQDHLLADQADAVAPGHSEGGSGSSDISDPTYRAVAALAAYARMERSLRAKIGGVNKALDELEIECQKIISESAALLNGKPGHDEPRCPGYSAERRARLGGCGNHLATYRSSGVDHIRPEYLCHSCLKEKRVAEREENAA